MMVVSMMSMVIMMMMMLAGRLMMVSMYGMILRMKSDHLKEEGGKLGWR